MHIALGIVLAAVLATATAIDIDRRVIPNWLTGGAALIGIGMLAVLAPADLPAHLGAALGAGGLLLVAALINPSGMGMGDVKLAAVMGLYLGVAVEPALLIAIVAGVGAGAVMIVRKGWREGRRTAIPFGPFLAGGGVVALLAFS
jgi:leader peptidase (prepilin peptidase) / N-methyltransferase